MFCWCCFHFLMLPLYYQWSFQCIWLVSIECRSSMIQELPASFGPASSPLIEFDIMILHWCNYNHLQWSSLQGIDLYTGQTRRQLFRSLWSSLGLDSRNLHLICLFMQTQCSGKICCTHGMGMFDCIPFGHIIWKLGLLLVTRTFNSSISEWLQTSPRKLSQLLIEVCLSSLTVLSCASRASHQSGLYWVTVLLKMRSVDLDVSYEGHVCTNQLYIVNEHKSHFLGVMANRMSFFEGNFAVFGSILPDLSSYNPHTTCFQEKWGIE